MHKNYYELNDKTELASLITENFFGKMVYKKYYNYHNTIHNTYNFLALETLKNYTSSFVFFTCNAVVLVVLQPNVENTRLLSWFECRELGRVVPVDCDVVERECGSSRTERFAVSQRFRRFSG